MANRSVVVMNELQSLGCPIITAIAPAPPIREVHVYPNPFSDYATINLQSLNDPYSWKMYNALGQLVQSRDNIHDQRLTILKGNLTEGIYLYQIYSKDRLVLSGKVVVE